MVRVFGPSRWFLSVWFGVNGVGSFHDEDQGGCSTRVKAPGVDLRIHIVFPLHISVVASPFPFPQP